MFIYEADTIAAISTPPGSGGIGIIRISGPDAVSAADAVFTVSRHSASAKLNSKEQNNIRAAGVVARMSSYSLKHGYIYDPETGERIDECLISVMRAPHSYTGEDVTEINSHGGYAVLKRILALLYRRGVRPAEPGEFTKRAFMNGRMALSEAEAVSDLIMAKTEESRKAAFSQLSGRLTEEIRELAALLSDTLAKIEVTLDYPEYEEDEKVSGEAVEALSRIEEKLSALAASYDRGRILREGFHVAICGRPNAGKSSLLNAMVGAERAIVTDIAGTTRDTIEEMVDLDGFPLYVTDTAGLRDTADPVEKIGVTRAQEEIRRADLVLFLADGGVSPEAEAALFQIVCARAEARTRLIPAINKEDLLSEVDRAAYERVFSEQTGRRPLFFSVREQGASVVFQEIRALLADPDFQAGSAVLTNERHKLLVENARNAVRSATESVRARRPLDFISYDVWECARFLGEITGENVTEDVIDKIFSKFCLGK